MQIFSVKPFKGTDGTIDPNQFAVRLSRRGTHPGVGARLITDALNASAGPEGEVYIPNQALLGYKRGSHYHMWFLSAEQVQVLEQHLAAIPDIYARVEEIRAELPKKSAMVATVTTLAVYEDDASDDDEDDDEDDEGSPGDGEPVEYENSGGEG